ncbi:MAG: ATP-dependent 6-phosphofructokinase [Acidimicrobiia bacterium]|nr:ATP-dependent 6-phosphofructokinase [Acidimicrobiia bacterium]
MGILTAGGDCPGLNAVIRSVVTRVGAAGSHEVVGIKNGWQGLMEDDTRPLGQEDVRGIAGTGGTILGTSRMDPYVHGDGFASIRKTLAHNGIDSVIVVGGDGTLRTALHLADEGLKVIGVPKTIDNDIAATDVSFGFDTAVQIATDAIDRLKTTAESHNRVMLCEVMGRTKGWIAVHAGLAAGADAILIPEHQMPLEEVAQVIRSRHRRGRRYSVVVVAEGVRPPRATPPPTDAFGFDRLGGVAYQIAPELEALTGFETRVTVLGHIQRGGTPTATDRVLATRLGAAAADLALGGGERLMVAVHSTRIEAVPLEAGVAETRGVDAQLFEVARTFFG